MMTAGLGVALAGLAVVLGAALAFRPALGRSWSSATSVFGSLLPLAVVGMTIGGLFGTTAALDRARRRGDPRQDIGGQRLGPAGREDHGQGARRDLQGVASDPGRERQRAGRAKPTVPLDPADQAVMTQQLTQAYQAAERFPTVASAKAAGMILAGGMAPGVGAHYQVAGPAT